MNILFCTQSDSLKPFYALYKDLKTKIPVRKTGYIVSDSMIYQDWVAKNPTFEGEQTSILKEWELTDKRLETPDLVKLARYEKILGGNAGLFGAIVADRRLFMGRDCTLTQDYSRRFSDDELLCILQRGIESVEELFDSLKPSLVVGFICVTMLDYLVYLFAKARGVKFFNLRPTRISDRVSFSSILNDPSPEHISNYQKILTSGKSVYRKEANEFLKRVREQHGRYEGVINPSEKPALKVDIAKFKTPSRLIKAMKDYWNYRSSISSSDNHVVSPLRRFYFNVWRNPRLADSVRKLFGNSYIEEKDLSSMRYVFFPMHTEPEVSLLVYGRPYVNQIELIRMIAISLPVDMVLLVKEHPWMIGKRSISAYKKILNIPRVRFVNPALEARILVKNASLVTVITGSIALEAAILGKPVITFGDCPYNLLPSSMVKRCEDPRHMQITIRDAIDLYKNDEKALLSYVEAVFATSASVSLYSVLLQKKNVHVESSASFEVEIGKLSDYLISLLDVKEQTNLRVSEHAIW